MYFRQHADCYGIGSYQHEPLLVDPDDIVSHEEAETTPALMKFTPQHFKAAHADAIDLLPPLRDVDLPYRINGMFSFTPDGMPLMGESPAVRGFWVAEAVWIHTRRRCGQGDCRVDGRRGCHGRPARSGPEPLSGARSHEIVH